MCVFIKLILGRSRPPASGAVHDLVGDRGGAMLDGSQQCGRRRPKRSGREKPRSYINQLLAAIRSAGGEPAAVRHDYMRGRQRWASGKSNRKAVRDSAIGQK